MKNLIFFENFQDNKDSDKSRVWNIFAGLGGGFGGALFIKEFTGTREEAEAEAYQEAKDIYDSYEGTGGLRTIEEIMISGFQQFMVESRIYKQTRKLYVADSTIENSGKGLFANVDFEEGEIIGYFSGKLLNQEEYEKLIHKSDINRQSYIIDLEICIREVWDKEVKLEKPILDVYHSNCMVKWANDAEGLYQTGNQNNAAISITEDAEKCFVYATENIEKGDEIFLSYGDYYWSAYQEWL